MRQEIGRPKREVPEPPDNSDLRQKIEALGGDNILVAMTKPEKEARHLAMDQVKQEILTALGTEVEGREKEAKNLISEVKKKLVRHQMLADQRRIDGRGFSDVRVITGEVGLLSRTHGSAVFTRGETQALAVTTLGTPRMNRRSRPWWVRPLRPLCSIIISPRIRWGRPA
jgi:polyribonucleotide nucleotidyltransferase